MYPHQELIRLAALKAALRRDIALCREQCGDAAARVTQPLAWLDRALAWWRRLPSLARYAAVPLGSLALRAVLRRRRAVRWFVRWSPLIVATARAIFSLPKTRAGRPANVVSG